MLLVCNTHTCFVQIGAESVNLIAGDKPADVYSGIAARYCYISILFSNDHGTSMLQLSLRY